MRGTRAVCYTVRWVCKCPPCRVLRVTERPHTAKLPVYHRGTLDLFFYETQIPVPVKSLMMDRKRVKRGLEKPLGRVSSTKSIHCCLPTSHQRKRRHFLAATPLCCATPPFARRYPGILGQSTNQMTDQVCICINHALLRVPPRPIAMCRCPPRV